MYSLRFSTCNLFDKDLYPLDLLENMLGNGEDSLLCRALIEDKNIAYSVSVASLTPSITTGFFDISVECELEHINTIKLTIMEIIDELKNGKFTDRLLLRAKSKKLRKKFCQWGLLKTRSVKLVKLTYMDIVLIFMKNMLRIVKQLKKMILRELQNYI